MDKLLLLATNGLIWGLIIALIALGLAIIFGLLDIINIAHGDFFMAGTVLAWATLHWTGSFWPAFVLAPLICFILGALSGVVAAPIPTVDFRGGVDILPFCFMAVIIGGLGNLPGTAAAAILLAFMEGVIQSFADPTVARISSLVLMSAVLLLRPQGLFGGFAR